MASCVVFLRAVRQPKAFHEVKEIALDTFVGSIVDFLAVIEQVAMRLC